MHLLPLKLRISATIVEIQTLIAPVHLFSTFKDLGARETPILFYFLAIFVFFLDVALFKSANQSSTWKDHSALKAVDNKKLAKFGQGSCCHTRNEQNPWWNVDLGASYNIVGVELTNRGDCCEDRLQMFEVTVDEQL